MQINLYQRIFRSVSTQRVAELLNKAQENVAIALGDGKMKKNITAVMQKGGLNSFLRPDSTNKAVEISTHSEHVFGWNFFTPTDRNSLIEIIKSEKTSDETIVSAHNLATAMGYKPIICWKDSPYATAYRILVGVLIEAARMAEEGLASPDVIDKIFLETFYPEQIHVKLTSAKKRFEAIPKLAFFKDEIGIYNEIKLCDYQIQRTIIQLQGKEKTNELSSLVTKKAGLLDEAKEKLSQKLLYAEIIKNISSLGSFYKSVPMIETLQQKAKVQFKAISDYQTQIKNPNDYLQSFNITPYKFPSVVNTSTINSSEARQLITDRLKGVYIASAQQVYLEGLSTPQDIEIACEEGFQYNYGPLKMARNLGKEEVTRLTALVNKGLNQSLPTGICKPGTFVELNDNELSGVQTYTQDNIGYIVMGSSHIQNLRKTDNSLSPEMIKGISAAINQFENDDSVKTIILRSQGGKVFCAGADLDYIKNRIKCDLKKSKEYMRLGKTLMDQIANCKKPTVAVVDGKMVGGGAEIAAACDYRILTVNATLAMPENALGLDPDWGGSERIPALIGKLLTVPLICNSKGTKWMWLNAREACNVGFGDNKNPILQSDLPRYLANLIEDKIEELNIHEKPNRKPVFDKQVTEYPEDIVLKFKLNQPYVHKWRLFTRAVARETEKLILNAEDPSYRENSFVTTNTKKLIGRARWVDRLYNTPFIMAVQNRIFAPILEKLGLAK